MSSALELSPSPRAINLFKISQIADAGPDRDDLDPFDLADEFKFHGLSVPSDNLTQVIQDGQGFLSLSPVVLYSQDWHAYYKCTIFHWFSMHIVFHNSARVAFFGNDAK